MFGRFSTRVGRCFVAGVLGCLSAPPAEASASFKVQAVVRAPARIDAKAAVHSVTIKPTSSGQQQRTVTGAINLAIEAPGANLRLTIPAADGPGVRTIVVHVLSNTFSFGPKGGQASIVLRDGKHNIEFSYSIIGYEQGIPAGYGVSPQATLEILF